MFLSQWLGSCHLKDQGTCINSGRENFNCIILFYFRGILEVPEGEQKNNGEELMEKYEAVYPYQSGEPGDLTFEQGELVVVIKKEGDWWTGVIGDRTGIFPSNYVQLIHPSQVIKIVCNIVQR